MAGNWQLWLRWSWRDLRERWVQVTVIALIIALGTGVYAGLGSTTPWRTNSTDQSYALLNMHDLRVEFTAPGYVSQEMLLAAVDSIPHTDWIDQAEARLIAPKFVDASTGSQDILVRGRIVGVDVSDQGPHIDSIYTYAGRDFNAKDDGQPVAILDSHFANYYELPASGTITLSDNEFLNEIEYVGHGTAPEYLQIVTDDGTYWAQNAYAVVFVPLQTAQDLTNQPGMVNNLVLTLGEGTERDVVYAELETALQEHFPGVGFTLTTREEDVVHEFVYMQIDINHQLYIIIAYLFLASAMFAAFNLATRLVEAQRRQIGISMALGLPRHLLMLRPLLVGAQIALLGVVFGLAAGLVMGKASEAWMKGLVPTPVYDRLFHFDIFLKAAILGLVLPFAATLLPVWRAVRVMPVDAITAGHLVARSGGLTRVATRVPLPGKSFVQMPVRNLLRAPRRTLLSVLGIASAVTMLVGMTGMIDTARNSIVSLEDEYYQDHPDRLQVFLNQPVPVNSEQVSSVALSPAVSNATAALRTAGTLSYGDTEFPILLEAMDLHNTVWTPTIIEGTVESDTPGLIIAPEAGRDLGVELGDTISLEHLYRQPVLSLNLPRRDAPLSLDLYDMQQTELPVIAFHAGLWRTNVYINFEDTHLLNMEGQANLVHIIPTAGTTPNEARRALFDNPNVSSVVSIQDSVASMQSILDEAISFLSWIQIAAFALAFLIAFNSTNININQRVREIATMFAFGLRIRTAARMAMLENLITGILGTLIGFGLGMAVVAGYYKFSMPVVLPEASFAVVVSIRTVLLSILMGVVLVALTPLLLVRRMRDMDLPAALRVME
ncbi:MAG: ABC transporter permease [Chloroflexi bacterium]|nr:ABC transporter permease [Chloroflexota bacterium]